MSFRVFVFTIVIVASDAYRILGVFPFSARSHNIVHESLMKSLAKHGHRVDVVSHYPQRTLVKNLYNIVNLTDPIKETVNTVIVDDLTAHLSFDISGLAELYGNRLCHFMGHDSMQRLIKNPPTDPPYDLVITEALFAHCYFGLGYVFEVPVIAVSAAIPFPWITDFTGNSENLAFVPNVLYFDAGPMNLFGRIKNVLINYIAIWKYQQVTEKSQTDSMRKYLRADMPSIRQIEKSVALTLVNTHPIFSGIKPVTPGLIQIGGFQIEANDDTLPTELKLWLDDSKAGVVYFSLGSLVRMESLPRTKLIEVYSSLEKIAPVRVLLKIANNSRSLPKIPENVKTLSWIPQQPVLAHPNVKAFISHGGLNGAQESVYHGVPMIAMPILGDQFRTVDNLVARNIAIRIDFSEFSEKTLDSALKSILHDPIYKKKVVYYSKLFRDQPMNSTSKAIFWIEYVIRNGADVLRSPALQLSTIQLTLLDVYGVILIIILFILTVVIVCIKIIARVFVKWLSTRMKRKLSKCKKQDYKIV